MKNSKTVQLALFPNGDNPKEQVHWKMKSLGCYSSRHEPCKLPSSLEEKKVRFIYGSLCTCFTEIGHERPYVVLHHFISHSSFLSLHYFQFHLNTWIMTIPKIRRIEICTSNLNILKKSYVPITHILFSVPEVLHPLVLA